MAIRRREGQSNINDPNGIYIEDTIDAEIGNVSFLALAESIDQSDNVNKQTSCSTPKVNIDKTGKNNDNNSIEKENSIIESENTNINNSFDENVLSKYNVLDKNKKIQEKNDDLNKNKNNNDDESDSDSSIWEVPVPPKPAPPLIDLPDSDDDDELNNNTKNNSSSSDDDDDDDDDDEVQEREQSVIQNDNSNSTPDNDDDDDDDLINSNENSQDESEVSSNIILNCTLVQKGASSLEEIKRMRDLPITNCTQDDEDSMTESEAMNWMSIEDRMANEKEKKKQNELLGDDTESWQNFDDSINFINSNEQNLSSGDDSIVNQPSTSQDNNNTSVNENNESTCLNEQMGPPKTTEMLKKRKRTHNLSINSENNIHKTSSPQKRQKQNVNSTANMSFDEYIFQPLPPDLVSFYNDQRNGFMNLEILELQRRMTKDPNRWAILDADMIARKRKFSRPTCSICQNEGHKKDHCPSKPNVMSCRMCGQVGHKESTCPHTMCLTCGKKYQTYRKTCEVCKLLRCTTCRGIGHDKTQCPDLWRKYHITTTGGSVIVPENSSNIMKPKNQLICCICRRKGHDASSCKSRKNHQHFLTPSSVTNYFCDALVETVTLDDSDDDDVCEYQKNIPEIMIISDTSDVDSTDSSDDDDDDDDSNSSPKNNCQEINWDIDENEIIEVPVVKKIYPVFAVSDSDDDNCNLIDVNDKSKKKQDRKEEEKEKDNCNISFTNQQSTSTINQSNECTDVVEDLSNNHENIPSNNDNIQESNNDFLYNIENKLPILSDSNLINDNEKKENCKLPEKKNTSCDNKVVDEVNQNIDETISITKNISCNTEKTVESIMEELNDSDKLKVEQKEEKECKPINQIDETRITLTENNSKQDNKINIDKELEIDKLKVEQKKESESINQIDETQITLTENFSKQENKISIDNDDKTIEFNDTVKPSINHDLDGIVDTVESNLEKQSTEVNSKLDDTNENEISTSLALKIDTNIIAKETLNIDDVKLVNNFEKSQYDSESLLDNDNQSKALDLDNIQSQADDASCSVKNEESTFDFRPNLIEEN